ncbi:MAG: peptide-binding protein [bacterium]
MKHNKHLLGLLLIVLIGLAACSQAPINKKKLQKPLTLNISAEPSVLNPILSTDSASSKVIDLVFSGLLRVSTNLELIPDLAQSYTINSEGTIYTFNLHKNAYWHDGKPVTAEDVKFTFERILDPKTNTVRRSNYIINGKEVQFKVINSHCIQAILPQPFAPFLTHMTMGILPKHLLSNQDINTALFNRNPIGSGPFVFQEWHSAQFIRLKRNENYYGKRPKLGSLLLKIIPDQNTALISLEKAEIDQSGISGKDYARYKDHPEFSIHRYEDLVYTYMGFNLKHQFFKDSQIRKAIAMAINKDAIVNGVLKGFGTTAHLPASPVSWAFPETLKKNPYPYNPEKSRQLLKAAGFRKNKQGILQKNGQPFEFTLITNKGNKDREKVAQLIQQFLKSVDIKVEIRLMEWSSFIKIVNAAKDPKDFDAVILGWSLGLDPDGHSLWHSSQYPKGFNFVAYNNAKVDKALQKGRLTMNTQHRKTIYKQVYHEIAKDLPYIFLYYPESLTGIQDRVKGLSPAGPAGLMNPIENVYLQP